jgi:hypothetical protein
VGAKAVPGAWPKIPDGSYEKIHPNPETQTPHVSGMQQIIQLLGVDFVSYALGITDVTRGTETANRMSAKFAATMQESAILMQARFTSAFTDYLSEGAVTMARLMLLNFDAVDIDRLLGASAHTLREGLTAQKNPQTGQLEAIFDPQTGQPLTMGAFLKGAVGELFDQDVGFSLRPAAASERMAQAMLMTQHGVLGELAKLGVPGRILAPLFLRGSFAEGSIYAEAAGELEIFYEQQKQQEEQAAAASSEEGWVQFIAQLGGTDFEKAVLMMKQAQEALMGGAPQGEVQ